MDHKLIPLVLVMIGTLVAVIFATSAVQPNPASAEYPPPPRPPMVPPDPPPPLPVEPTAIPIRRSGGSSSSSPPDLELVQLISATTLRQGDLVEITLITRHVDGSRPAEDVLIFLELPVFFSIMSAQTSWGMFAIQGEQIAVQIPVLYRGDEVVTTIVGMVDDPPLYAQMQLIGSVNSSTPDSNFDNNMMGQMVFFP